MSWGAVAIGVGSVVGGLISSNSQKKAADQQNRQATNALNMQMHQFEDLRNDLSPWRGEGRGAVNRMGMLSGIDGAKAQKNAIGMINNSPQMLAMIQQGENAIRQNASATGGLRGGNTQAALAQFRPQVLNQLIEQQYSRLSDLAHMGQNAAAMTGQAGQGYANSASSIMAGLGESQARSTLAQGQNNANMAQGIGQGLGLYFNNQSRQPTPESYAAAQNRS
jgi:hypothetical protein